MLFLVLQLRLRSIQPGNAQGCAKLKVNAVLEYAQAFDSDLGLGIKLPALDCCGAANMSNPSHHHATQQRNAANQLRNRPKPNKPIFHYKNGRIHLTRTRTKLKLEISAEARYSKFYYLDQAALFLAYLLLFGATLISMSLLSIAFIYIFIEIFEPRLLALTLVTPLALWLLLPIFSVFNATFGSIFSSSYLMINQQGFVLKTYAFWPWRKSLRGSLNSCRGIEIKDRRLVERSRKKRGYMSDRAHSKITFQTHAGQEYLVGKEIDFEEMEWMATAINQFIRDISKSDTIAHCDGVDYGTAISDIIDKRETQTNTSILDRIKAGLSAIIISAFPIGYLYINYSALEEAKLLQAEGVITTAVVQEHRYISYGRGRTLKHQLSLKDGQIVSTKLKKKRPIGKQISILYSPSRPSILIESPKNRNLVNLFLRRAPGILSFIFTAGISLLIFSLLKVAIGY